MGIKITCKYTGQGSLVVMCLSMLSVESEGHSNIYSIDKIKQSP